MTALKPSHVAIPQFSQLLRVGTANIGDCTQFLKRMNTIFDQRTLTNNGPYVREFELMVQELLDVRHCVATTSGTMALHLLAKSMNLTGEVIMPSFTYIATAHAMHWLGITPVFCDVDPRQHLIDTTLVESLITEKTTAILGVHLWGNPCAIESLQHIADQYGVHLVFDSAHAFGVSYNGTAIGNFGDAEIVSFHASKIINTFEGGAILTNDDGIAERARIMRALGLTADGTSVSVGTNGKMSEPAAAMGISQLEQLEYFVECNKQNYAAYSRGIAGIPGLTLVEFDSRELNNWQYIVIDNDESVTGVSRDTLVAQLEKENLFARCYFSPGCHRSAPYRNHPLILPVTERLSERLFVLPTGETINPAIVDNVCTLIKGIIRQY